MNYLHVIGMHVGDAGASALAAALGRGVMPRLNILSLHNAAVGDAGLVALAPAWRRRPALEELGLIGNRLGDEGLAALVAPPLPAGALPPPTGVLAKLKAQGPPPQQHPDHRRRLRRPCRRARQRRAAGAQDPHPGRRPCQRRGEGRRTGGTEKI